MMKLTPVLLILIGFLAKEEKSFASIPDSIFNRTVKQALLLPQEKVYLHTDRESYIAGENIWMRAYVVDGITHVPSRLSRYVYVTLQNPFLEKVLQVKLRADSDGAIYGNLKLPEDLPKGEYYLSAYTQYMRNFDQEYFFKKRITINSMMSKGIRLETSLKGRDLYVSFFDTVTGEAKEVKNCMAKAASNTISTLHEDNGYKIKFYNTEEKVVLIQAGNYKEFINVNLGKDYDVNFLPEGGNLINGNFNRIAFKCVNSLGQGEDITGSIRDENDSILLSFQSTHRGMGMFSFIPQKDRTYTAVCQTPDGIEKRFQLPAAVNQYSIQVNEVRDKYYVKVLTKSGNPTDSLYILAHQKGWPVMIHQCNPNYNVYTFNTENFTQGTISFLLFNAHGKILNERMVFLRKEQAQKAILTGTPNEYAQREKVRLTLDVSNIEGKTWSGDCSIAITDNYDVAPDSCTNIWSSLLLESDLRGYIEEPAWYFRPGNEDERKQALDILMMTQGWRKYNLEQSWDSCFKTPEQPFERSMSLTGKITTRITRKGIENALVRMMVPLQGDNYELTTNAGGEFRFDGFEYPDSTQYWVSAYDKKGKGNVVVVLDTIIYPALQAPLPFLHNHSKQKFSQQPQEFISKVNMKLFHENGIRHYFMDEVLVTAPKKKNKTIYEKALGSKTITEETIRQSGVQDVFMLVQQQVAGVSYGLDDKGNYYFTIRGNKALLVIDDVICYDAEAGNQIAAFNKNDIEQIDVLKPPFSGFFDPRFRYGVVVITTKKGGENYNAKWIETNLKSSIPLGFQLPTEFYAPKYEYTAEKENKAPDLRTTIYWNPTIKVKDGKADFEFYTADGLIDYSVVIEGVSNDGELLRVEKDIK